MAVWPSLLSSVPVPALCWTDLKNCNSFGGRFLSLIDGFLKYCYDIFFVIVDDFGLYFRHDINKPREILKAEL